MWHSPSPEGEGLRLVGAIGVSLALACLVPAPAWAQQGAISRPVVQEVPTTRSSLTLNRALARLGQNPRDVDALIDAGDAALDMGDVDASVGFYRRADQISPGNGRVKAGLAGALVHSENPYDAIPMFEEAERAGAGDASAGERGLAYDLVGDNERAQRYYLAALARGSDDEITRRLALSYAMAGDRRSSETTLTPLLQRQDKAGWRTRAFALAILGQVDEAVSIASSTLPPGLASGISPYLRYMPKLTPAQQAAAANLGHFPRASEIGRDDPRVAQYAPKTPRKSAAQVASADAALTPRGQPLGRGEKARDSRQTRRDRQARSETAPIANTASRATPAGASVASRRTGNAPIQASAASRPTAAPSRTAELPPVAPRPTTAAALPPASSPPASTPAPGPSLSISPAAVQGPPAPMQTAPSPAPTAYTPPVATTAAAIAPSPVAAAPRPAAPAARVNLADAFSDFLKPTIDVAPAEGAVDVRRLAPSRQAEAKPAATAQPASARNGKAAAAAKPAKPPPPSHPSRIWVQVATGRNKAALAFDWRRMTRENAQALRGKSAFTSTWGQTNRLLTGPFATEAAANAFIAQLRRADIDGAFLWTSPAGQVVDPIAGK